MSTMFQADSDQLREIAATFAEQADTLDQAIQRLTRLADALREGGWEGRGAQSFFETASDEVIPALKKIQDYLDRSHDTAQQTARGVELAAEYILSRCKA